MVLPSYAWWLRQVAEAEQGDGWLVACDEAGRYLAITEEFVARLGRLLWRLAGGRPVLEVCAGRGELAETLRAADVPVVATDREPPPGAAVLRAEAAEALRQYRPRVVLGSFVPVDAGVDAAVLNFPTVCHYVWLGARLGGGAVPVEGCGPRWKARPLPRLGRWMLTRHDVWLDLPGRPILQHGEAWWLRRRLRAEGDE